MLVYLLLENIINRSKHITIEPKTNLFTCKIIVMTYSRVLKRETLFF